MQRQGVPGRYMPRQSRHMSSATPWRSAPSLTCLANTLMRKCHCATIFPLGTETVQKMSNITCHCEVIWGVLIENWLTNHFSYTRCWLRFGVLNLVGKDFPTKEHLTRFVENVFTVSFPKRTLFQKELSKIWILRNEIPIERVETSCAKQNLAHKVDRKKPPPPGGFSIY